MSRDRGSHLLLAGLSLAVGTAVMCPLMPLVALLVFAGGIALMLVYLLVSLWPRYREEHDGGQEEDGE